MRIPNLPPPKIDIVRFGGGLDQATPPLEANPGSCIAAQNVEVGINRGYETSTGYERLDGRPKPSAAVYYVLPATISGTISPGDTITGDTSSATGVVIAVEAAAVVFTKLTGTFQDAEDLTVSAVVQGTTTDTASINGASTPKLHAQYKNLAADEYRSDIAVVPGSGDLLGVWRLNGAQYAVRNNAGGTAAVIHKSSSSGWTAVALGRELAFTSGGTTEISEGDTITGATSSATAVITRVVLESGSWSGGDAAGRLIFANQTGTFQSENLDVGASVNLATIAGDSSAIALLPDGRFETDKFNFGGQSGTFRVYGCDGVNRGFEFDGTVFVPIDTGMDTDTPTHVICHKNHLFFSFAGSAQHSGIGTPYIFSPIFGAAELAVGDDITAFKREPGAQGESALLIFSRNRSHVLYGSSSSDWNLVQYREEVGAFPYTVQQIGITLFMDDRGITNLQTSQAYGNFQHSSFSNVVQKFILLRKDKVVASTICRAKNQYRIFFNDDSALYVTMNGNKLVGIMPMKLNHTVTCADSTEDSDGTEVITFGSDDGYVYQMEKGTSFDGDPIEYVMITHFNHAGSPRLIKGYKSCALEVGGDGYSEAKFTYELDYGSSLIAQAARVQSKELSLFESRWDLFTWDEFYWDSVKLSISDFRLAGSGENIALIIRGESDYASPLKLTGAIIRYLPRRQKR